MSQEEETTVQFLKRIMRIIGVVYAIYCFGPIILDLAIHCLSKSGDEVATSASLAVSIPAPTPQQFFPEIRLNDRLLKITAYGLSYEDRFVYRNIVKKRDVER